MILGSDFIRYLYIKIIVIVLIYIFNKTKKFLVNGSIMYREKSLIKI